ncbi:TPA: tandem-type lipoprotein [Staphylococcus aureus]|nr:tandem-type lipoprotein [Staphylococcus aureus]
MKCFQKLYIFILILIVLMAGCESNKITGDSKETQIKKSFAKTLDVYPTKNLEDFYDREGYRDGEFKKGDKGKWVIRSEITTELKNENMVSKGMVIRLNRNSRTCTGEYFVRIVKEDSEGKVYSDERKYPVKMENNKIIPLKPIDDEKVKKEIEELENYKEDEVSYNPEVPIYSAKYQLKNSDYNVEQLRKRYNIPTKKAPKLLLKGSGNLKDSSVGYKNIEFTFIENKEENIYFTDSIYFNPSVDK